MNKLLDDLTCEIEHNRTIVVDRRLLQRAKTEIQRLTHAVDAIQYQLDQARAENHTLRGQMGGQGCSQLAHFSPAQEVWNLA